MAPTLTKIGSFESEIGAEIAAYDDARQVLYVVSGDTVLEVIDISDPTSPVQANAIDLVDAVEPFGATIGGANSVAYSSDGLLAIALEADPVTDNGFVAVLDAETAEVLEVFTVGALPDSLTFTPDGTKIIVANEGEPDADDEGNVIDPEGSVSIIDLSNGIDVATVSTADFTSFNGQEEALRAEGVRLFPDVNSDGLTVAQDLEPEFIAVSDDSTKAFVTLQENNAIAIVDIETATVESIEPLGLKDYSQPGNGLDASDRDGDGDLNMDGDTDGAINIDTEPVFGLYMPDSIASFESEGETFYIIANEGDDRGDADEDDRGDAIRLKDVEDVTSFGREGVELDPSIDPALLEDDELGRLTISSIDGDTDGDGDIDQIVAYGGRSFSILNSDGEIIFDSGDQIAQITAEQTPEFFNANDGDPAEFDNRSDNKGAEPEAVTTGVIDGVPYAFVGLERAGGGVLVYDLSDPTQPEFVQYARDDEDIAPEGLVFIEAADSPNGGPILVVANEVSSTVAIYSISTTDGMEEGNFLIREAGDSSALFGTDADEFIAGRDGDNSLFGGGGNDTLLGDLEDMGAAIGNDNIFGGSGNDLIIGGAGNDTIGGESGNDTLLGGEGNDVLLGGEGIDILIGGGGTDIFILEGGTGEAIITDFESGDLIGLAGGISASNLYKVQDGNNTVIGTFDGDLLAVALNTTASQFTEDVFLSV